MSGSDPCEYQTWVNNLVESTPNTIVLSSQEQDWAGLDVALLRYTQKQVAAPAFANHLIVVHLNGIPHFVSERDGQIYETEVTQGDVSILPAGGSSDWQWHKRGRCDSLHLALETTFIRNVAAEIGYSNPEQIEILNHFIVHDPQIQHLGLVLKAELESGGLSGHLFGESIATALAIRLVTQYSASGQLIRERPKGLSQQQLQLAIAYIHDHLSQELRLAEIAAVVGISQSHFSRLFKQSMGLSPYQYVIQCRVERARLLLQRGDLAIEQVALLVGFADQSHLTYHFKRLIGVTPKRFMQG